MSNLTVKVVKKNQKFPGNRGQEENILTVVSYKTRFFGKRPPPPYGTILRNKFLRRFLKW